MCLTFCRDGLPQSFFCFSSRRLHTRSDRDWSSDVCSSDLLRSLQEFIQEGDNTSSLGIEVQEAQRKTRSGKMADGLVIVGVIKGSPADLAGLRAYRRTTSDVIKVVAVVAALVFPPAVLVAALADQVNIGD